MISVGVPWIIHMLHRAIQTGQPGGIFRRAEGIFILLSRRYKSLADTLCLNIQ